MLDIAYTEITHFHWILQRGGRTMSMAITAVGFDQMTATDLYGLPHDEQGYHLNGK